MTRIRLVGFCMLAAAASLTALWVGCSSTSPRFRTDPFASDEDESRHAARIRAEEEREDDRKVDVGRLSTELRSRPRAGGRYSNAVPEGINRDRVLLEVVSVLGVPYAYGGMSRAGFDCSGFTVHVYRNAVNRSLPRSTRGQFEAGTHVSKNALQFGDLVFFNTTGRSPSHVGIYVGENKFVHSMEDFGVIASSLDEDYYKKRYLGARRVIP